MEALANAGVRLVEASSLYETEPMYLAEQPAFLNAVVRVETELSPEELLAVVKDVERRLGRQPRERNGPREIDIDILTYGNETRDSPELTIPHPRMAERPFVQAPLAELEGRAYDGLKPIEGPGWAPVC